MLTQLYSHR